MVPIYFVKTVAVLFGLMIGSFLNALIYRLPLEINIAVPRSQCPNCNKLIPWYENIPVFSYLFLLGKCSGCKTRISIRYPLIELFMGLVAFLLVPANLVQESLILFAFLFSVASVFVVHFFIDLDHKILPDSLNIYLALVFLLFSIMFRPWSFWLYGGLIGFLFPLGITWAFYLIKGQIGLGGGDIKLWGALGLYLGPLGIIQNIALSCMLGTIICLILILLKKMDRKSYIPFGPFIIVMSSIQIFFPDIFEQYISLLN